MPLPNPSSCWTLHQFRLFLVIDRDVWDNEIVDVFLGLAVLLEGANNGTTILFVPFAAD